MIILGLFKTTLIVIGTAKTIIDEELVLYIFSFPGVLQSLLINFNSLRVKFELHTYIAHGH